MSVVLDATAKFPSGITDGYILWMGAYDMCLGIKKNCEKQKSENETEIGCPHPKDIPMDANYCITKLGPFAVSGKTK